VVVGAVVVQAVLIHTVQALKQVGVTVKAGCVLVGLPRATFYRVTCGYRLYQPGTAPTAHRDRRQPAALSAAERQVIVEVLGADEYAGLSVQQAYWRALDAGLVACSQRTFYRVADGGVTVLV
jgi:putative transposase